MKIKVWFDKKERSSIWNALYDIDIEIDGEALEDIDLEEIITTAVNKAIDNDELKYIDAVEIGSKDYEEMFKFYTEDEAYKNFDDYELYNMLNLYVLDDLLINVENFRYEEIKEVNN